MSLQISISKEYEDLIPRLKEKQYESIKQDILEKGQLDPIDVNEQGIVLDGHNRFKICKELGIKPKFEIRKFATKEEERNFVIERQLRKRNSKLAWRIFLSLKLEPYYRKLVNDNMSKGGKGVQVIAPLGKVRDQMAAIADCSHTTWEIGKEFFENAPQELIDKVLSDKDDSISIFTASGQLNKQVREKKRSPLPTGTYEIVLADPAWEFKDKGADGNADSQYETMPLEEIKQLVGKMNISKDSACFLWVPTVLIQEGLDVLKSWNP